jgi:hypothetical protein
MHLIRFISRHLGVLNLIPAQLCFAWVVDFILKGGENGRKEFRFPIMIQLTFTDEEIEKLHYERFHHPSSTSTERKMEALYLKSQKYRHKEITKLLRITEPTLLSYLQDYKAGGVEKLKELTFNRPQSEMKNIRESLEIFSRTSSKEFSPMRREPLRN